MKIIARIIVILGILLLGLFYYLTSSQTNELNLIINPNNRPEIILNEETRTIRYKYSSGNDLTVNDFFASSNAKLVLYYEGYPIELIKFDLNNTNKYVYAIITYNRNQIRYEIVFDLSKTVLVFDEQNNQIGYVFKTQNNKINSDDLSKLVGNANCSWYADDSFLVSADLSNYTLNKIYFKTDNQQVTVSFQANGGNAISPVKMPLNGSLSDIPVPLKTGYQFSGWYDSLDNDLPIDLMTTFSFDTTLYAKWELISYTITYHTDGSLDEIENPLSYSIESNIILVNPSKEGYSFIGWYDSPLYTNKINQIIDQTGSLDLYAKFEVINYTITYNNIENIFNNNPNCYSVIEEVIFTSLEKNGYTFIGWSLTNSSDQLIYNTTNLFENISLYPIWQANSYMVTYNLDSDAYHQNPLSFIYDNIVILSDATKEGYHFAGWFSDEALTNQIVALGYQSHDLVLYAKWSNKEFSITYNLDGGVNSTSNPATVTISDVVILNAATKDGYSFIGWYDSPSFTNEITVISNNTSNLVLYAKWNKDGYSITYNLDGGVNSTSNPATVTISDVIILSAATKEGYDFIGWYTDPSYINKIEQIDNQIGNLNLYAKFEVINYTITYHTFGALNGANNPNTYNIASTLVLTNLAKEGYNFIGWYTDSSYINKIEQINNQIGNLNLYAKFEVINYTITYHLDGSTNNEDNPNTYNIESTVELTSLIKEGYNFIGWYTDPTYTNKINQIIDQTGNLDLYAKFEVINYSITYHLDGGVNSAGNPSNITISDVIILSAATKEGYDFIGWYTDPTYTNKINQIIDQTGNLDLYAKFEVINYSITYHLDGGVNSAGNPVTYNIESYDYTLKPITKDDYIFEGWFLDGKLITNISYFGYDIILTAKFIPILFIFEPYQNGYKIVGTTTAINDFASVNIPSEYQNKPVLRIDSFALSYLDELKELTIPNSVISIGTSILLGTTNLQTLTIPFIGETKDATNGVIGYLFGSLIKEGNIKVVQDGNSYYIPEQLTTIRITDAAIIANHAFNNMVNLVEVTLNDQINKIGNFAFNNTTSLETLNLPLELKTIGNSAFFNTGYNKELIISANVNAIGAYAFYNAKLTRIISYATLNAFETNTFGSLPQLEQLVIYNVISITSNVIVSNPKLTKISLMDNVRTINFSALSSNKALRELYISNSVTSITKGALHGLEALETLIIPFVGSSQTPTLNNEAGTLGFIFGTISYNNSNFINQVYNEAGNLFTGFYIPKTLKHLSITNAVNLYPGALYGLATLETISLNEGIMTIYAHALSGIKKVNKLILPSSVTKINNYSLANSNFEELFINSDQIQFGNNVFNNTTLKLMIKESSYDTIVSALTTQVVGSGVITTFKQK